MAITQYRIKAFFSKSKKRISDFYFGQMRDHLRKRRTYGTIVAILAVATISFYGLSLRGQTGDSKNASAADSTTNITNNYNFAYDGVSINVKAENISNEGFVGTATARSGDKVRFTLTINNPTASTKVTDVVFNLPAGFSYVDGTASNSGFTSDGVQMLWNGYSAPAGNSTITFETLVP